MNAFGQEMLKRALPRIIHLLQGWRTVQPQMFVDDLVDFRFATAHDLPPRESLIHFFSRALALNRVTATVPRDLPNSFAIAASLHLWTYRRISISAQSGLSRLTA